MRRNTLEPGNLLSSERKFIIAKITGSDYDILNDNQETTNYNDLAPKWLKKFVSDFIIPITNKLSSIEKSIKGLKKSSISKKRLKKWTKKADVPNNESEHTDFKI